jgi:VIT1/CCC1 family predicted Fe2+/Mn2+ transporter
VLRVYSVEYPKATINCLQDAEKLESGKAAAIAAAGGAFGSLPYLLVSSHPLLSNILSAGSILLSCFLFGVTYRCGHSVCFQTLWRPVRI